jgi:hypothetical protein
MIIPLPLTPAPVAAIAPPRGLEKPERLLWQTIVMARDFTEPAPRAVLAEALAAHARARRCRAQIDRDGELILDRFGQQRAHPLLASEATASLQFTRSLKLLGVLQ